MTIRKVSLKRLRANGGKPMFSTIAKKSHIEKHPRSKSDFNRIYGSRKRVEFVKSLLCAACGVLGFSENAHVAPSSEKGTGYKAGYRWIAPLCRTRFIGTGGLGCHFIHDNYPSIFATKFPAFDPEKAAAETEAAWLSYLSNGAK